MKLIMTKGLPGSGKSTWAKEQKGFKRINKDDLRDMFDTGQWSGKNEQFILRARDNLIALALGAGQNVIVDDTNLHPKHEQRLRELAKEYKAHFEIKDFTDVPIEICIDHDLMRLNSVGERVIRRQYKQFLAPKNKVEWIAGLPPAIICDIDGTLALFEGRSPYDRDFSIDDLNEPVAHIIGTYSGPEIEMEYAILLVSGRKDKFREVTEKWLADKGVLYDHLWMRKTEDERKDFIIKEEIYREHIEGKYNVLFVLDDRNRIVELWRSLGLTTLQVADGDF